MFSLFTTPLKERDPEIHALINKEMDRQRRCLNLIASENYSMNPIIESLGYYYRSKNKDVL